DAAHAEVLPRSAFVCTCGCVCVDLAHARDSEARLRRHCPLPCKGHIVTDLLHRSLALPVGPSEALSPGRHRDAPTGEFVHFFPDLAPDVLRQLGRGVLEARKHLLRCGRPVMEEAAARVPNEGALARVDAVTQLEQRYLPLRLPDEE